MAKVLPLELLYRIYKAEIGDVIDDKYMKASGVFNTDDDHSVDENGFIHRKMSYTMGVINIAYSQSYFATWEMKRAPTPDSEVSVTYFHEPFVDGSIVNYEVGSLARTVNGVTNYHDFSSLA
ncbi:hypothetical protein GWD52_02255 [Enterobacteriaceae bacterium 4M9]|nr:hypothetical protein [Enterobacteriaceae bacterium 4M9]